MLTDIRTQRSPIASDSLRRCRPVASAALAVALAGLTGLVGCGEGSQVEVAKQSFDSTVCAAGKTIKGIDVSVYQGNINWSAVKNAGIQFAYIRVSDGTGNPDSKFAQNWSGSRSAGVIRGAYQFFRPEENAVAEANLLLKMMGTLKSDDLPPTLDVEVTDGVSPTTYVTKIHNWVNTIEQATGRKPVIYVGKYFWQDHVASSDFKNLPLWIAEWGPSCPNLPDQWSSWKFWQTADNGSVSGISGAVDTDVFNGTRADLLTFAGGSIAKCGDGVCNGGETSDTCPGDCPVCGTIPAKGQIIDDTDACFEEGGDPTYMRHVTTAGYGKTLTWTHTTDYVDTYNYGIWHLNFASAGSYDVKVYTDTSYAQSKKAAYLVTHNGTTDTVKIDQTAVNGWQDLGTFQFAAGGKQKIRLNDNTGEAETTMTQLVFDAVQITPANTSSSGGGQDAGSSTGGSGGVDGGTTGGTGGTGGGTGGTGGGTTGIDAGSGSGSGSGGAGGAGGGGGGALQNGTMIGGCSVAPGAGGAGEGGAAGLLLIAFGAAVALRRRRD